MKILGIETSFDETALALLEVSEEKTGIYFKVLGNIVLSQIELHKAFGGVVPMMAKREHAKNLVPLLKKLFLDATSRPASERSRAAGSGEAGGEAQTKIIKSILVRDPELLANLLASPDLFTNPGIDAIAVTHGPGLEPALWVGISFAQALGLLWNIPIIPTNHMEGHIVASLIPLAMTHDSRFKIHELIFPAIALLISGGHTELVLVKEWLDYKIIGQTRDDAVGEAFDKVARLLDLPYPGGPEISKLAELDRKRRSEGQKWNFPRPMKHSKDFDFSFSGLKTAVLYTIRDIDKAKHPQWKEEIAREFEDAASDILVWKTGRAIEEFGAKTLIVGGGVIANNHLRERLTALAKEKTVPALFPQRSLSTDNALMIALAGYFNLHRKTQDKMVAIGNLKLS